MLTDPVNLDDEAAFNEIARERTDLADLLNGLSEPQLQTPSLCEGWTVRDVSAHILMPMITKTRSFAWAMLKAKWNWDVANVALTEGIVERYGPRIPELLRQNADNRVTPAKSGPLPLLTDIVVHGQDIRRPLGLNRSFPPELAHTVLNFLMSSYAERTIAKLPRPQVRWEATDIRWSAGAGPTVQGPAEALMLLITGRPCALADISGDGAPILGQLSKS
ncbi:maleylpyruvate isomerase family mycothiol-dependent enzyme [Mycobacteroides abscessus]|uniref:maleylpyruvate isomerase family mycothiol-dependent enzyme n=1 Tax=Mycobacteroides abscessus TaxID=36809 RepID=UPI000929A350|nr:maleylpyruvate isomerase family mycothiol-dependent enzyme [Mycobacteroides abscessus]MDO2986864.1 maleylpyruvate isomerase family mycothiol-dependent enzyme [Mycobacteroides abscessus subsp. abscessus]SIA26674.1 DinB family protein [Mycobacteroides abscessus subsp. abscessus]SID35139.1 DinB family protein [Mycobacteroides abscessus subsp. abscessus]SIJ96075.1 DinB family protein [Mycobacteroides abscessus subsp. abscessus]